MRSGRGLRCMYSCLYLFTSPRCVYCFFFSSRRRHTRLQGDWSSDVCSSDLSCASGSAGSRAPRVPREPADPLAQLRGLSFRSCASGSAGSRGTRGARAGDNYAMDPQRMFGMTPWVRRLIVANLVVFLLQVTLFVSPGFVATLGFAPLSAFRQPWTF